MADLHHWWGGDLSLAASGDLLAVDGLTKDNQRIVRRLCTNGTLTGSGSFDCAFHTDYGGSLPWYIGQVTPEIILEGLIRQQMYQDGAVSHSPEPTIASYQYPTGLLSVRIQYTDAWGHGPRELAFDLTG